MTTTFEFDPYTPEVQADPFPFYDVLRRERPLYRDERNELWVLSRYRDVRAVLQDHETYASGPGVVKGWDPEQYVPIITNTDPPQHTRLRKALGPQFAAAKLAAVADRVRAIAAEVADGLVGRASADLIHDFAAQVPVRVISELTDVPLEDFGLFTEGVGAAMEEGLDSEAGMAAFGRMIEYFERVVDERTARPGEDLISAVVTAEVDGEALARNEQVGLAFVAVVGGIEATTFHLGNTCAALGLRPDVRAELAADRSLVPGAGEELLRYDSPVQADLRTLTRDVELHGERLEAGDRVMVLMGSANRDPEVFESPDVLDIRRSPNPHLAFMVGIHLCAGAALGRLESKVAIEELLARVPEYHLVDDRPRRTFTGSSFMLGVERLPVEIG